MDTMSTMHTKPDSLHAASGKLSFATKLSYGLGDFASQLVWTFTGSYLTVFYTDVVGLTPAIVSVIMLIARVWDGINDPMMGAIAERTRSRFGRFRPYIIYGTPILALFSVLCFTAPGFGGNLSARAVWAAVTYIFLGMSYTAVNLCYGSLSTVMSYDPTERTQLNSFRMVGTHLGSVLLNMVSMPLILLFSGVGDGATVTGRGYTLTTIVFAVIAIPLFYFMVSRCKEVVKPAGGLKKVPLRETLRVVVTNKPLMIIFAIMLCSMTGFFGRMGVAIYYYMYVLQRFDLIALLMTIPSLFTALAIMVTSRFIERVGKKRMCIISYALTFLVLVAIYLTDVGNITMLIAHTALYGACSFAFPIPMAMVPEAIDYAEEKTGVRADGTSYATVSLATKFASAIGGSVGIIIMGAFGYVANAQQTAGALNGINLVVNIMPAVCYALAIVFVLLYPLRPEQNAKIRESLQAKAASRQEKEGLT